MTKISSSPFFYKRVFPAIWVGFLAFFMLSGFIPGSNLKGAENLMFIIWSAFVGAVGFFVMKKLVFDLLDEVYEEGETLIFKNRGKTVMVSFNDIKNVNYQSFGSPPKVTISIRHETELGNDLSFCPVRKMSLFKRQNPEILALIDRIDEAKRRA